MSIDRQQKYEHESQYETLCRPGDQSQYEHRSTQQTTIDLQRQQLTLDARAQQAHLATHTPNSARDRDITRARQDQVRQTKNHSHQTSIEVNDPSPTQSLAQTVNPMHTNANLTIIQNDIELELAERALEEYTESFTLSLRSENQDDNLKSPTQHQFKTKSEAQSPEQVDALQRYYSNIDNLNALSRARDKAKREAQDLKNQTDDNSSVASNTRSQSTRPKKKTTVSALAQEDNDTNTHDVSALVMTEIKG